MIEWFKNLSEGWQIAIFVAGVTVGLAAVGGLFALLKWLFRKKSGPSIPQTKIQQKGAGHTTIVADGSKVTVAGRDIIIQKPAESLRQDIRPSESTKQVTLVIENLEAEQFDTSYQRLFCFGIAGFLGIAPSDVRIVNVEKGSIKVTVEVPEKLVRVINKAVQERSPEFEDAMKPLLVVRVETEADKVLEEPGVEGPLPAEALVKVNVRQLWGVGGFLLLAFVIVIVAITCASRFGGGFWNFIAAIVASFVVLVVLAVIGRFMGVFSEGMVARFLDVALKALRLGISKVKGAEVVTARYAPADIDGDLALKQNRLNNLNVDQVEGKCRVLILAGGQSVRWRQSIGKLKSQDAYHSLYWNNVVKVLKKQKRGEDLYERKLKNNEETHKSCALLREFPLIGYSIKNCIKCRLDKIAIIAGNDKNAYNEIRKRIETARFYASLANLNVEIDFWGPDEITDHDIVHSVYEGLHIMEGDSSDTIVLYSDIIWNHSLLKMLLETKGDIVFLVDSKWKEHNYPAKRIWHNQLFAELVFIENDQIDRIGEAINRFEIPDKYLLTSDIGDFGDVFSGCLGEIIGMFKFSEKGKKFFLQKYREFQNNEIEVKAWTVPSNLKNEIKQKPNSINPKDLLLGSFLEFLAKSDQRKVGGKELVIKPIPIEAKNKWAEIDHYGDLFLTEEKYDKMRPYQHD